MSKTFSKKPCIQNKSIINNAHEGSILSIKILSNGNLISSSRDKHIKIWHNNFCVFDVSAHSDTIRCLELLPNKSMASGSADGSIKIWLGFS
jgi:WD40 repeat protein